MMMSITADAIILHKQAKIFVKPENGTVINHRYYVYITTSLSLCPWLRSQIE